VIVTPQSLSAEAQRNGCEDRDNRLPQILLSDDKNTVNYTYSVYWEEDKHSWGSRWDLYLHVFDPQIHWFSIIDSIIITLVLSGMVIMIILRALRRDIMRYNLNGDEDGAQEDFGWKMVHADVFRPPVNRMLLCVLLGSGAQILCMACITIGVFC
jgi:transmembrane 9 superfamily protein 2/4